MPLLHVNADENLMHPIIKERNWLTGWEEDQENFDFEQSFQELLQTIREDADYIRQHTQYLIWALEWERNQKQTQYLLIGEDRVKAESWLQVRFTDIKQAPCIPTDLHCQYICESTKNANNLLTQVFICHNENDHQETEKFVKALNREGITTWTNKTDIQSGKEFQEEINKGIEGADNLVYLLSPNSVSCPYCKRELAHALKYNKRIIPILIESIDLSTIPVEIKDVQFIDLRSPLDHPLKRGVGGNNVNIKVLLAKGDLRGSTSNFSSFWGHYCKYPPLDHSILENPFLLIS